MDDFATSYVSDYVRRLNINIAALSRQTKIPDGILRRSIVRGERPLRADEFLEICFCLGKDPLDFRQEAAGQERRQG